MSDRVPKKFCSRWKLIHGSIYQYAKLFCYRINVRKKREKRNVIKNMRKKKKRDKGEYQTLSHLGKLMLLTAKNASS
jgi:hypothetical protein